MIFNKKVSGKCLRNNLGHQREKSPCKKFSEEELKIRKVTRRHKTRGIKFLEETKHMQRFS